MHKPLTGVLFFATTLILILSGGLSSETLKAARAQAGRSADKTVWDGVYAEISAVGCYRFILLCPRNRTDLQRAWKHLSPIREREDIAGRVVRTIFRAKSLDHNGLANFQSVLSETLSDGHSRRQTREAPCCDVAFIVLHIDIEPDVGIHPLHSLDQTSHFDRLGHIELSRFRMVREQ